MYLPAGHTPHSLAPCSLVLPFGHGKQAVEPSVEYVPASQNAGHEDVAPSVPKQPLSTGMQERARMALLYWPAEHIEQVSVAPTEYVPGWHGVGQGTDDPLDPAQPGEIYVQLEDPNEAA